MNAKRQCPPAGLFPAAAEEEQVLHSRDSGVGILSSDQVAIQHNMHSIWLAGTEASTRVLHEVLYHQWQAGEARSPYELIHRGPCKAVAVEHPGPVLTGGTAQGSNTMADGTDGLALRVEVLQDSGQRPTASQVSQGPRTAGDQEGVVPGTVNGLELGRAGVGLEAEVLHPACIALSHIHEVYSLPPRSRHLQVEGSTGQREAVEEGLS